MLSKETISPSQKRERMYRSAAFLKKYGDAEIINGLQWGDLDGVPDFVFSSAMTRDKFIFTAATMFYFSCVQRCIQGHKIKYIKGVVGDDVFDMIAREPLPIIDDSLSIDHFSVVDGSLQYAFANVGRFFIASYLSKDFPLIAEKFFPYDSEFINRDIDNAYIGSIVERSWGFVSA